MHACMSAVLKTGCGGPERGYLWQLWLPLQVTSALLGLIQCHRGGGRRTETHARALKHYSAHTPAVRVRGDGPKPYQC